MRVIAGSARSLPLKTPEGTGTRPTTDRIKETLFNMLQTYIPDCVFLDLFCGSGAIGIEALSRGARRAYFVENDRRVIRYVRENLAFTKLEDRAVVLQWDALSVSPQIREDFVDVIFLDPPYGKGLERQALDALKDRPFVTQDTLIVIEALREEDFSWAEQAGFSVTKEKKYKTNKHVFLRRDRSDENSDLSGQL